MLQIVLILVVTFIIVYLFDRFSKMYSDNKPKKTHNQQFVLCNQESLNYAIDLIQVFAKNLSKADGAGYHSRNEYDNADDVIRSFYFVQDWIEFCESSALYKNKEFETANFSLFISTFRIIDVQKSEIPETQSENFKFGNEHIKKFPRNQAKDLNLIYWRKKKHWLFWANYYDDEELKKRCIEIANSLNE